MSNMTFKKQIKEWMKQDGLPVTEKYVAPLFQLVMSDAKRRHIPLREAYEKERPNIEEKLKDEKVSKGELHYMDAEEQIFVQKINEEILFCVGDAQLEMSVKKVKQLIDILETVVNE